MRNSSDEAGRFHDGGAKIYAGRLHQVHGVTARRGRFRVVRIPNTTTT